MASNKRLMKERAKIARDPIPYVTFQGDEDDGDESMSDAGSNISEWRLVLALNPAHDSPSSTSSSSAAGGDNAASASADDGDIGKASESPYCTPPPSSSGKKGGILSGVARAAKSSKKSSNDTAAGETGGGKPAYFAFQLDFPENYPFKPPKITVLSESYHPNVKRDTGEICDHVLTGDGWGPTLNVKKVCARLRRFLCEPDPGHPLEGELAQLLTEKPADYAAAAYKHAGEHCTKEKAMEAMARGKAK